ncbi:MAG: hypothetical protein GX154_06425 [Clostridiales bacterium]|nr:hypothetical protein [Clostridiales bacterium]
MIFKELLEIITFNDVWKELVKEYSLDEKEFGTYLGVFNQLKELKPDPNHDGLRFLLS